MRSYRTVLVLVPLLSLLMAVSLRFADALIGYGPPAPDNYMLKGGPDSRYRDAWCPLDDTGFGDNRSGYIWTGAGSDTVVLQHGSATRLFDSASPQTADKHDMLMIEGVRPNEVYAVRQGAHLLICGKHVPFVVEVLRHYCHGTTDGVAWNNQVEEIVFSSAGEIWLADAILDAAPDRSDIAALTRMDGFDVGSAALQKYLGSWHVSPFSNVLPSGWLSSLACRRDMIQRASEGAQ